ncbi:MAG: hypothetical protein SW833_03080 [Cyanobacteriota bacterium]|nr:hypothetical protein [Cyanobacteriota bacterium]
MKYSSTVYIALVNAISHLRHLRGAKTDRDRLHPRLQKNVFVR